MNSSLLFFEQVRMSIFGKTINFSDKTYSYFSKYQIIQKPICADLKKTIILFYDIYMMYIMSFHSDTLTNLFKVHVQT